MALHTRLVRPSELFSHRSKQTRTMTSQLQTPPPHPTPLSLPTPDLPPTISATITVPGKLGWILEAWTEEGGTPDFQAVYLVPDKDHKAWTQVLSHIPITRGTPAQVRERVRNIRDFIEETRRGDLVVKVTPQPGVASAEGVKARLPDVRAFLQTKLDEYKRARAARRAKKRAKKLEVDPGYTETCSGESESEDEDIGSDEKHDEVLDSESGCDRKRHRTGT